jgi:hypothetical protein
MRSSSLVRATLGACAAAVALLVAADGAAQPAASVADRHIVEGHTGTTAMDFTVTLSEASTEPVTVSYSIESLDGYLAFGADLGTDYLAEPEGVLIFEPGQTSKVVPVAVVGDEVTESDEYIMITVSGATADDRAFGAIINDDQAGAEPLGCTGSMCRVRFPILSVLDPATGTWQPGAGSVRVTLGFSYDDEDYWELDWGWRRREYSRRWFNPLSIVTSSGRVAAGRALYEDEPPAFWQCSEWDYDDDGYMDWCEAVRTFEVVASCEPDAGTAEPCAFSYFADDSSSGCSCWGYLSHLTTTEIEEYAYDIEYAEHGYVFGPATFDAEPRVSIADTRTVAERGYASFTVSLDAKSTGRTRIDYATEDGTATAGLDYVALTGSVVFEPGELKKVVKVAILKDSIREENETFRLVVTSAAGATMLRPAGTATITDDEVFAVTAPATVVGCLPVNVKVTLPGMAPAGGVTVTLASDNPKLVVPASLFFKAGALSRTFKATTLPVAAREPATITAFMPGEVATDTVTLKPMGPKALTMTPNPVVGGNPVAGTVTLQCPAGPGDVTVTVSSLLPAVAVASTPTVVVPAGTQAWPFGVTTFPVDRVRMPTISVTANGISKGKTLTVNP